LTKKKIISLITVLVLIIAIPMTSAANSWQVAAAEKVSDILIPMADAVDDTLPPIPEGYSYRGDRLTDEHGVTIYYIYRSLGSSGVSVGYWIDQQGNPVINNAFAESYLPTTDVIPGSEKDAGKDKSSVVTDDLDKESSSLPSSYDARKYGYVTGIEAQEGGTCWAMASIAAIESNAIKQGFADKTLDLNEYFSVWNSLNGYYTTEGAATNSLNDGYISDTTNMMYDGGNPSIIGLSLLNFSGAIREDSHDIAITTTGVSNIISELESKLNINNKYLRDITLEKIIEVGTTKNTIKQAVLDYGGLYIGFPFDDYSFYSGEYITYYSGNKTTDSSHAVELIGWDDNFSRTYFDSNNRPKNNGAWLCKNSWGSSWGDGGYFWMSYEQSINSIYAFKVADPKEFDTVYMYDGVGASTMLTCDKAANIFTADKNTLLTRFSYGSSAKAQYTLNIYKLKNDYTSPEDGVDGNPIYTQSGTTSGEAWTKLNKYVQLNKGDKFSVVISVKNNNNNSSVCFTEGESSDEKKYTSNEGESFCYVGGKWIDTAKVVNQESEPSKSLNNVCIRVVGADIATFHDYSGVYKNNGGGTHSRKCLYCDSYSQPVACTPTLISSVAGVDCKTEGKNHYKCTLCGYEYDDKNGIYGDHQYVDNKCNVCNKTRSAGLFQTFTKLFSSIFKSFGSIFKNIFGFLK